MQAFLESFNTPEEIASECRKRGIKGQWGSACNCPIACLIRNEFPDFKGWINVYPRNIDHVSGAIVTNDVTYPMSKAMNEFGINFDDKKYPDLIKESPNV